MNKLGENATKLNCSITKTKRNENWMCLRTQFKIWIIEMHIGVAWQWRQWRIGLNKEWEKKLAAAMMRSACHVEQESILCMGVLRPFMAMNRLHELLLFFLLIHSCLALVKRVCVCDKQWFSFCYSSFASRHFASLLLSHSNTTQLIRMQSHDTGTKMQ